MNFDDTPQEAEFRAKARAFLSKHLEPLDPNETAPNLLGEREDGDAIAWAKRWQATKFDAGWAVLTWPKEYGGQGLGRMENVIFNQEEPKFKVPPAIYGIGHGMLGPTLMTHGTKEQKERYVKEMARGQVVWCQLFSEPAAGSDLAGLRTSAVRDGGVWVIDGQKIWTSGAHYCKWGMLVARTDASKPKHDGLTYFIVDMHARGIEIRPIKQINGGRNFNEVFFSGVRVPDSRRVGGVGEGWRVSITTLMNERASLGAGGSYVPSLHNLIRLARSVEIDGRPALENSAVRQRIAEFHVRLRGVQHAGARMLTALSRGQTPGPEASIGKLVFGPLGQEMASFGIELQSMAGGDCDPTFGYQDAYLAAPGMRIAGGTDEIMRNILAERVLRLPPEPRMDKDVPFREIPTGRG
jgi:alkylation response protein AidB-like acyl-CoA dehydrogenase